MIERLLAAERALAGGELGVAGRLFGQVAEADPRNAIAVVGLARVALGRGDPGEAHRLATAALAVDPDDSAARRLLDELGAAPPSEPAGRAAPSPRGGFARWLRRLLRRPD